jgi:GGDEF domain-containing protein
LLKDFVRTGEVVARVGGDEFYLVLDEPDRESLDLRIHALHNATRDFRIGAVSLSIGLSAGGAVWNLGDDTDEVLSRADAEMYATKAVAKLAGTRRERLLGADIEAISETRRR